MPDRPARERRPTERRRALEEDAAVQKASRSSRSKPSAVSRAAAAKSAKASQARAARSTRSPTKLTMQEEEKLRHLQRLKTQQRREENARRDAEVRRRAQAIVAAESSDEEADRELNEPVSPLQECAQHQQTHEKNQSDSGLDDNDHQESLSDEDTTTFGDIFNESDDGEGMDVDDQQTAEDGASAEEASAEEDSVEDDNDDNMSEDQVDNGIDVLDSPTQRGRQHSSPSNVSIRRAIEKQRLRVRMGSRLPPVSPKLSLRRVGSSSPPGTSQRRARGVYKVVSGHFTPRTRRLGEASKRVLRSKTTNVDAYPADLDAQVVEAMTLAANSGDAPELQQVLARVLANLETRKLLSTFVKYGRGGLLHSLIQKARSEVPGQYGIPGKMKPDQVTESVKWLVEDGHFKYGDINLATRSFNAMLPYGADIFRSLIRLEYFMTKGGANILAFKEMIRTRRVGPPTIALVATVTEHALGEYSHGTHRKTDFTDTARSRYLYHLDSYQRIAKGAGAWAEQFEKNLFTLILSQSNKSFMLEVESNDMNDVDLSALAAAASAASSTTSSGTPAATITPSSTTTVPSPSSFITTSSPNSIATSSPSLLAV